MSDALPSLADRAAGVLLHPTCLPSPYGCGDLGAEARAFVDFLAASGQRWWQMLPTGPVGPHQGYSPYSPTSAYAGHPLLIDLRRLVSDGLLSKRDLPKAPSQSGRPNKCDFEQARQVRDDLLPRAFDVWRSGGGEQSKAYRDFQSAQSEWLEDYAVFAALEHALGARSWLDWPLPIRTRRQNALLIAHEDLASEIAYHAFLQFLFDQQWTDLRQYAAERGVGLIGDIPIFVAHHSADVWSRPNLFDIDAHGRTRTKSGVPPDLFSKTGQLWNHPHYRWANHEREGFAWWIARFRRLFEQVDAARIDHFIGFHRLWAVPGAAKTAQRGTWTLTPGAKLFQAVQSALGPMPIIAEDLGLLTPETVALRDKLGFPGMRLMQFAFGSDGPGDRYNQPHTYPENCVAYTGTHDNATTVGWIADIRKASRSATSTKSRTKKTTMRTPTLSTYQRLLRYVGGDGDDAHWRLMRLGYFSSANTVIYPLQDLLGLGNEAMMNRPGVAEGNWDWRMAPDALTPKLEAQVRETLSAYGRVPEPETPQPAKKTKKAKTSRKRVKKKRANAPT